MISFKTKKFFDRKAVIDQIGKKKAAGLSKAGAFVQRRMKSIIRKRNGPSKPGTPPSSHVGLLKKFIFFEFDTDKAGIVVGPERLPGKVDFTGDAQTVPELLNYGGNITTTKVRIVRRKAGRDRRGKMRPARVYKKPAGSKAAYPDRPFAEPALEAERPNFPGLFGE